MFARKHTFITYFIYNLDYILYVAGYIVKGKDFIQLQFYQIDNISHHLKFL